MTTTPVVTLSDSERRVDVGAMRAYRLARMRRQLRLAGCGAALLFDPINVRYASGRRGNSLFNLHIVGRSLFVPVEGPVILFDWPAHAHLAEALGTIDEVRAYEPISAFFGGPRSTLNAQAYARDVATLVRQHGQGGPLAIDKADLDLSLSLREQGIELRAGQEIAERARSVKCAEEIACMNFSIAAAETGMANMREALRPGITENQLWSLLHQSNIAMGGEWILARLLSSGDRTNPWGQECSDRVIRPGELVAFDCDMVGPYGYCADVSRTWHCGPGKPTAAQKDLYRMALEEITHNLSLLKAGMSFRDFADAAWKQPADVAPNRYPLVAHGIGMYDEFPTIYHASDWQGRGFDGEIEENMVLCIESYIGKVGGSEGVKLERQVLVTRDGAVPLDKYPFEQEFLE
ncbi:MAG: Xaa-Pro peptidase family protein [Rubrivivax sp.]